MSTVVRLQNHGYQLYTKGASEIVLQKYVLFRNIQLLVLVFLLFMLLVMKLIFTVRAMLARY